MYPRDHAPPHVHVEFRDGDRCTVEIRSLRVRGSVHPRRKLAPALAWIEARREPVAGPMEGDRPMKRKPPTVTAVQAIGPATLKLTFGSGETLPVDVSALLRRFRVYAPLRQARAFSKVRADSWGHALRWPAGSISTPAASTRWHARKPANGAPNASTAGWATTASR
jgi:hypothetical protein